MCCLLGLEILLQKRGTLGASSQLCIPALLFPTEVPVSLENLGVVWLGRDLKGHPVANPFLGQGHLPLAQDLQL